MPFISGSGFISGNGYFIMTPLPTISALSINNPILTSTLPYKTVYTIIDPNSNSSGAFTYTSSDPTTISISGKVLTVLGISGQVTITATQAETANYTFGSVSLSCTVVNARLFWGSNINGQLGTGVGQNTPYLQTDVYGLTNITAIATGNRGCLALTTSKTVKFWGHNQYGQLGTGVSQNNTYYAPTDVPGLSNISAISISPVVCLALTTSQTVKFWGLNNSAQMGTGFTGGAYAPADVPGLSNITAISTNWSGALALDTSKNVWFWGNNYYGQLGDTSGNVNIYRVPTKISDLSNVTAISIGYFGCLALTTNQTVKFWGGNNNGQLGTGTNSGTLYAPTDVSGLSNITAIAIGFRGCLALTTSQTVKFWGDNSTGQLGNGTTSPGSCTPTDVSGLSNITAIALGHYGCLAKDTNNNVWFWGSNTNGQFSNGVWNPNSYVKPTILTGISNISAISLEDLACAVLTTGNTVKTWGNNTSGHLGTGVSSITYLAPTLISGINNTTALAIGPNGCLGLTTNNTVKFWGYNTNAQLGTGVSSNTYYTSTDIAGLTNISAIAIDLFGCLALDMSKNVWFWGNGTTGQLGSGGQSGYLTPTKISGLADITAIALNYNACLALTASQTVKFWGWNNYGHLGTGVVDNLYYTPRDVSGLTNITAIAICRPSGLALTTSNTVKFWGSNECGQLGNSAGGIYPVTDVPGLTNITAIAMGSVGCLGLTTSKTVKFWGRNDSGQLGTGVASNTTYCIPTDIAGLTNITAISMGNSGCLALDTSQNVWFWGSNTNGQFGNGLSANTIYAPTKLSGVINVGAISISDYGCLTLPALYSMKSVLMNSSNYLSINTAILPITQTTFTVEAWIYPTSFDNISLVWREKEFSFFIGDFFYNQGDNYWSFGPTINGILTIAFSIGNGNATTLLGNTVMNTNTWNHICAVSNGTTIYLYVNGKKQTNSIPYLNRIGTLNLTTIGKYNTNFYYSGYATNIRISNSARYTVDFTPPISPFTSDANTLFLMQYDGTDFVDNSPNKYTISKPGTPTVSALTPYFTNTSASIVLSNIVDTRDTNTYNNYIFTASGSINLVGLPTNKKVYLLAVGGGGGGGGGGNQNGGGGGGAGGLVQTQLYPSSTETITVNIGLGGAMNANGNNTTVTSSSSNINVTAYGGGAGGLYRTTPTGTIYGSTGGAGRDNSSNNFLAVTQSPSQNIGNGNILAATYQGKNGGASLTYDWGGSGAGGGAGTVGGNGRGITGSQANEIDASGGSGTQYSLYGMASPYNNYYWAGGGGGAVGSSASNQGGGGIGGGGGGGGGSGGATNYGGIGGGSAINSGGSGTLTSSGNGGANTGGGGGGAFQNATGGLGGSGIVILMVQQ